MRKIPKFKLVPEPLDEAAADLAPFRWAPKEVGKRHQLGGVPNLLNEKEWPNCPSGCGKMSFYGQLDSINDDFMIADCGVVCVFICFECFEAAAIVASY